MTEEKKNGKKRWKKVAVIAGITVFVLLIVGALPFVIPLKQVR